MDRSALDWYAQRFVLDLGPFSDIKLWSRGVVHAPLEDRWGWAEVKDLFIAAQEVLEEEDG